MSSNRTFNCERTLLQGQVQGRFGVKALQVKQGGIMWITVGNQPKRLPKTYPKSSFFNLEQYKEKATSCPCFPNAGRGMQQDRHCREAGHSSKRHSLPPKSRLPPHTGCTVADLLKAEICVGLPQLNVAEGLPQRTAGHKGQQLQKLCAWSWMPKSIPRH